MLGIDHPEKLGNTDSMHRQLEDTMTLTTGIAAPETGMVHSVVSDELVVEVGIVAPETGMPQPTSRPVFGVDWGHGKKFVVAERTEVGAFVTYEYPAGLVAFIRAHPQSDIIIESTAGSFDPHERNTAITLAAELGVALYTVPPRRTAALRKTLRKVKTDANDAIVLLRYRERGEHLGVLRPRTMEVVTNLDNANRLRLSGWPTAEVNAYLADLPSASLIPTDLRVVLATGKRYNASFVVPLVAAARDSNSREVFDRLVGAYAHGCPRYTRSNFYHHRVPAVQRHIGGDRKTAMRLARRATRWVYSQVAQHRAQGIAGNGHLLSPVLGSRTGAS